MEKEKTKKGNVTKKNLATQIVGSVFALKNVTVLKRWAIDERWTLVGVTEPLHQITVLNLTQMTFEIMFQSRKPLLFTKKSQNVLLSQCYGPQNWSCEYYVKFYVCVLNPFQVRQHRKCSKNFCRTSMFLAQNWKDRFLWIFVL